jgi:hypothetical protein
MCFRFVNIFYRLLRLLRTAGLPRDTKIHTSLHSNYRLRPASRGQVNGLSIFVPEGASAKQVGILV